MRSALARVMIIWSFVISLGQPLAEGQAMSNQWQRETAQGSKNINTNRPGGPRSTSKAKQKGEPRFWRVPEGVPAGVPGGVPGGVPAGVPGRIHGEIPPAGRVDLELAHKPASMILGMRYRAQACIDRLIQMASTDPLILFEGSPEKIVNDSLLWNNSRSECSVRSDQKLRFKIFNMATAWRLKDAAKTRLLLEEIRAELREDSKTA